MSYHSVIETNTNHAPNQPLNNDSNPDMIPHKQIISNTDKCSVCRHAKKFDIIHKKILNLNDSAILSFSLNSNNSKALNRNVSNEVNYIKENCSNLPMDNQEYYYCYSTMLTPEMTNCSNFGESACSRENLDSNKQVDMRRTRNKLRKAKQTRNQNCCLSCFFCCSNQMATTKICIFMNIINTKIKNFVDGNFFQRAILFSILINTFCMGIEHHQQVKFFLESHEILRKILENFFKIFFLKQYIFD